MGDKGQWYSNKELFELITNLQHEMKETRSIIKQYNGLYKKFGDVKKEVDDTKKKVSEIQAEQKGRMRLQESIIAWGGWFFGLVSTVIALYAVFN